MSQESPPRKATKRYQNSSYPSGSFEAAIENDQKTGISEGFSLRLERHPSMESESAADLEEMIPAFMRRDFFRSKEEAGENDYEKIEPLSAKPSLSESHKPEPVRAFPPIKPLQSPSNNKPLAPSEDQLKGEDIEPVSIGKSPSSENASQPAPLRSTTPSLGASSLRQLRKSTTVKEDNPLPVFAAFPPTMPPADASSSVQATNKSLLSDYSMPLLIVLALTVGLLAWREQVRSQQIAQAPLPIPHSLPLPTAQDGQQIELPAASGSQQDSKFNYLWVGPPSPAALNLNHSDNSSEPTIQEEKPTRNPDDEGQTIEEGTSSTEIATTSNSTLKEVPSRAQDEVSSTSSSPPREAKPNLNTTKKASSSSQKSEPVNFSASAADLFPIDEELPLSQPQPGHPTATRPYSDYQSKIYSKPTFNYPADPTKEATNNAHHQPTANTASTNSEAPRGYKIAEPNI